MSDIPARRRRGEAGGESGPAAEEGRPRLLRAISATCLLGAALAAGSAALWKTPIALSATLGSPGAAPSRAEALLLGKLFTPKGLSEMEPEDIGAAAQELARTARDSGEARDELALAFPPARAVIALLALDRDVDDFIESSSLAGPAGEHYRDAARLAAELRPLRGAYETLYGAAYEALAGPGSIARAAKEKAAKPKIAAPGAVFAPDRAELPFSHPYALDVFFTQVERHGEAETGPRIYSLSPGIVVAAAADWRGGSDAASWKGGGLSPASGNGVVVYDPAGRRYYSYFHLSEVNVLPGQTVERGKALGKGGNTGMNARKRGHGGHVHVEVFDAARGSALSADEIMGLLF